MTVLVAIGVAFHGHGTSWNVLQPAAFPLSRPLISRSAHSDTAAAAAATAMSSARFTPHQAGAHPNRIYVSGSHAAGAGGSSAASSTSMSSHPSASDRRLQLQGDRQLAATFIPAGPPPQPPVISTSHQAKEDDSDEQGSASDKARAVLHRLPKHSSRQSEEKAASTAPPQPVIRSAGSRKQREQRQLTPMSQRQSLDRGEGRAGRGAAASSLGSLAATSAANRPPSSPPLLAPVSHISPPSDMMALDEPSVSAGSTMIDLAAAVDESPPHSSALAAPAAAQRPAPARHTPASWMQLLPSLQRIELQPPQGWTRKK